MEWMTDGTWGFAGVVIGILLTTLFGFVKSAVERRWARQDQAADRLFEYKRSAHLEMTLASLELPEDPTPKDIRKALKKISPASAALLIFGSSNAGVDAIVVEQSLERLEEALLRGISMDSEEGERLYDQVTDGVAQYALSARRDLGAGPARRSKRRMSLLEEIGVPDSEEDDDGKT